MVERRAGVVSRDFVFTKVFQESYVRSTSAAPARAPAPRRAGLGILPLVLEARARAADPRAPGAAAPPAAAARARRAQLAA